MPATSAWKMSGYWVAEWLPQIVSFLMSLHGAAGLGGQLRQRPVVVQTGQRGEALLRDVGGVGHRDQRVGVGRVAGHADADVVGRDLVERLALGGEDRAVGLEQVAALHALGAGAGADEQGEVRAVEDGVRVVADLDAGQRRERAVVELHDDALERLEGRGDLQQLQLDRGVLAEQVPARDPEEQAVADLAGGAGDGDLDGGSAHGRLLVCLGSVVWTSVPTLARVVPARAPRLVGCWRDPAPDPAAQRPRRERRRPRHRALQPRRPAAAAAASRGGSWTTYACSPSWASRSGAATWSWSGPT